jgi:hypothetical protein
MKINWGKVAAFLAGGCVGAAISAFVTDKVVSKAYSRAADDEIHEINSVANERIKKARKEVTELKQKVAQQKVTINTLADQVRESGKDVSDILKDDDDSEDDPGPKKVHGSPRKSPESKSRAAYTAYSRRYSGEIDDESDYSEEAEFPEDDPDPEEEEAVIEERGPVIISGETFDYTALDYIKELLDYYIYDGKVVNEDGEYLDNYAHFIGEEWLKYGKNAGDTVYVRNDFYAADYCITWVADYGEKHINVNASDSDWED